MISVLTCGETDVGQFKTRTFVVMCHGVQGRWANKYWSLTLGFECCTAVSNFVQVRTFYVGPVHSRCHLSTWLYIVVHIYKRVVFAQRISRQDLWCMFDATSFIRC